MEAEEQLVHLLYDIGSCLALILLFLYLCILSHLRVLCEGRKVEEGGREGGKKSAVVGDGWKVNED